MTELELIDTIAAELTDIFKGWTLKGKGDALRPVRCFRQYLPQSSGVLNTPDCPAGSPACPADRRAKGLGGYTDGDYESNFPCVIVKHAGHTDNEQGRTNQSMTAVTLILGTYDDAPECQGYRDLLNMTDAIRCKVLQERVIGNKFWLSMPVTSKLLEADTWPVYFAQMDMTFATGRPVMGKDFFTKEAV